MAHDVLEIGAEHRRTIPDRFSKRTVQKDP